MTTYQWIMKQVEEGKEADVASTSLPRTITSERIAALILKPRFTGPKQRILLSHVTITGKLDLASVEISYPVSLTHCTFVDDVDFSGTLFKRSLCLYHSAFSSKVNFRKCVIQGDLNATAASFKLARRKPMSTVDMIPDEGEKEREQEPVSFKGIHVTQDALFNHAVFSGPAEFRHMRVDDTLDLRDATMLGIQSEKSYKISLAGTIVGKLLRMDRAQLSQHFSLSDMTFTDITASIENRDEFQSLLDLVDARSDYNVYAYRSLEEYFKRKGYPDWADRTFIAQKRRARENLDWYRPKLWGNYLLDWLIAYGRSPGRAFVISLILVVFGALFPFRKQNMALESAMEKFRDNNIQRPSDAGQSEAEETPSTTILKNGSEQQYNPLWYSLDLFLPFIDLQPGNLWHPRQDKPLVWHYARVHILLGWILIPVGLAAITGLIK